MTTPIRTEITEGARYFDEPLYETHMPRPDLITPVAVGLAEAFKSHMPTPIRELVGYQKVRLRWMEPDGNGGLVPKKKRKTS